MRLRPKRVDVIEFDIPPEILCESDALPAATYRWLSSSFLDKFIGVIADTPLLSLNRSIERDRAGTYTCIASNRHGEDRIDLLINVLCKSSPVLSLSCTLLHSPSFSLSPSLSLSLHSLPLIACISHISCFYITFFHEIAYYCICMYFRRSDVYHI